MTFPANWTRITVTGTYTQRDGNPATGRVVFVSPQVVVIDGEIIVPRSVEGTLDENGSLSVLLPATDDPDIAPTGWTWLVREYIDGLVRDPWSIEVAYDGGDIDLATVSPAVAVDEVVGVLPLTGGTLTGELVVNANSGDSGYPLGPIGAEETGVSILSSFDGGEDDESGTDSTGRLNLYSYQRAAFHSFGEVLRVFNMRKDAKSMMCWYFPDQGYDEDREPVGSFKPAVWTGAHWEANNHASNHKHWSLETPDSAGALQTRFEIRFGNPSVDNAIAGLDKTIIATNLADFVVRCTDGQQLRLSSPLANGSEKAIEFNHDYEGSTAFRRWRVRVTGETESGGGVGTNFQIARYDDSGTFVDNPVVISRATGNVTLGPGFIARRSSATVSSMSLNSTSLGGGIGVIAIGNANTVPASDPTGGGVLYVEGGALKYRGSSGTITTIANA